MAYKDIIIFSVTLFAIVAAVDQETRHTPHNGVYNHHSHGHGNHHGPIPTSIKPEAAPLSEVKPVSIQEEIIEEDQTEQAIDDENFSEVELEDSRKVTLKSRQEETEDTENDVEEEQVELLQNSVLVNCNFNLVPGKSCFDCRTRLICKSPNIGKAVGCYSPLRPYCNNGICTATPSANC